jgi:uncharacterized delta-60 repeat protein
MKTILSILLVLLAFSFGNAQQSGMLDASFNFTSNAISYRFDRIASTANSKYFAAGRFQNGLAKQARLIRLKNNGDIDSTYLGFNLNFSNYIDTTIVNTFIEQPDGKIIVGGRFALYNNVAAKYLVRLNPNGQIDNTFNTTIGFDSLVKCVKLLPDGRMYVGGKFTKYKGYDSPGIIRLNSDASIDTSFHVNGGFNSVVNDIEVDASGNVIAVGEFFMYGLDYISFIARLDSTGTLDQSFNAGGSGVNYFIRDVDMLSNGQILIAGEFTDVNGTALNRIAKLNSNGTVDNTFSPLSSLNGRINAAFVQPDNAIMIGGEFTEGIMRINSNGSFDNSFNPGSGVDSLVTDVFVQNDNKVLLCGNFTSYNGTARKFIARALSPSIQIDTLFSDLSFCAGDTFQISFTPSGNFNAANSFRVQLSNPLGNFVNPTVIGLVASTTADTITCTLPASIASGNYRIRVISTTPFIVGSQYDDVLLVQALPNPNINIAYDTLSVDSLIYTSYQWYFNDTAITGANASSYNASQNGIYNLEVSTTEGCVGRSADFNMITVGVKTISSTSPTIFPNPAHNQLFIAQQALKSVEIYSSSNMLMKSIKSNSISQGIDVSDLPTGIYFVKTMTDENTFISKILIQ